jgi:hypothetical protein
VEQCRGNAISIGRFIVSVGPAAQGGFGVTGMCWCRVQPSGVRSKPPARSVFPACLRPLEVRMFQGSHALCSGRCEGGCEPPGVVEPDTSDGSGRCQQVLGR